VVLMVSRRRVPQVEMAKYEFATGSDIVETSST
jgi:hypothetical protein